MCLNIVAVGSNKLIAEEVLNAVKVIIGDIASITAMTTASVQNDSAGDFFICAVTQKEPLSKVVSPEKLIVLDLRPTLEFFVQVSRIPAGETVYIFNSNINYAQLLKASCESLNIRQVNFVPIAYEDMPSEEVISKLRQARHIIGVGKLVEREVLLSERYKPYLRSDVKIIGNTRVATMQSACFLIQRVTEYFHTLVSKKIAGLVADLKQVATPNGNQNGDEFIRITAEIEKVIAESNHASVALRNNIMRSFAAQISWNIVMETKEENSELSRQMSESDGNNGEIVKVLKNIDFLSGNLR
ncbi:MAG: hypothetical protein ABFC57_04590 [Veillonellales bacterium]